jgi:hypothetical protein
MMTPQKYLELANHCSRSAAVASDPYSRYLLETLAESYFVLAKSREALRRSEKALQTIDQRRKQ